MTPAGPHERTFIAFEYLVLYVKGNKNEMGGLKYQNEWREKSGKFVGEFK